MMSPVRPAIAFQASDRNPARYSIGHSAPYSVADGSPECHCSTELIPSYPFSKLPIQTPSPVYSPVHGVQYTRVTGLVRITSVDKLNYEGCGAGHLTSCTTLFTFPRPQTHIPKGGHSHSLCYNEERRGRTQYVNTLQGVVRCESIAWTHFAKRRKGGTGDHAFTHNKKDTTWGAVSFGHASSCSRRESR